MYTTTENNKAEAAGQKLPLKAYIVSTLLLIALTMLTILGMGISDFLAGFVGKLLGGSTFESATGPLGGTFELIVFFAMACLLWKWFKCKYPIARIGLAWTTRTYKEILLGIAVGLAAIAFAFATVALFGDLSVSDHLALPEEITASQDYSWITVIYMIIVYAAAEEVIFRGFLYPWMRSRTGFLYAMLSTSLIFSLFHLFNPSFLESPFPVINIILAGIFLTLLRELTGNLWLATGVHFAWNFAQVAVGVPVSGIALSIKPHSWFLIVSGPEWLTGGTFGPEGGLCGTVAMLVVIAGIWRLLKLPGDNKNSTSV